MVALGRWQEAERAFDQAGAVYGASNKQGLGRVQLARGRLALKQREFWRAFVAFEQAAQFLSNNRRLAASAKAGRAYAIGMLGDGERALSEMQAVSMELDGRKDVSRATFSEVLAWQAELLCDSHQYEMALRTAQRSLALQRPSGDDHPLTLEGRFRVKRLSVQSETAPWIPSIAVEPCATN